MSTILSPDILIFKADKNISYIRFCGGVTIKSLMKKIMMSGRIKYCMVAPVKNKVLFARGIKRIKDKKNMKSGGKVTSKCKRDGIAIRGRTKGRMV